jgi:ribosomal protein S18 acetylase RimI-like enzyme
MSERLERVPAGPERDLYLPLFLLADDSMKCVRSYYQTGVLLVLRADEGTVRGLTLVVHGQDGSVELKAVAVVRELQGRGVGRRMLGLVLSELRNAGVRRVTVGTASCGIGQLAFYQKAGFRLLRIDRDFFTTARGYPPGIEENGIALRDMVWMDQDL